MKNRTHGLLGLCHGAKSLNMSQWVIISGATVKLKENGGIRSGNVAASELVDMMKRGFSKRSALIPFN